MHTIFDDFSLLGFADFPSTNIFNTCGLKDQYPVKLIKTEEGYKATIKTLGIEQVEVIESKTGIIVQGKNEIDGLSYDMKIELPIAKSILDNIKEIHVKTIAGVTVLNFILNQPKEHSFKVIND